MNTILPVKLLPLGQYFSVNIAYTAFDGGGNKGRGNRIKGRIKTTVEPPEREGMQNERRKRRCRLPR